MSAPRREGGEKDDDDHHDRDRHRNGQASIHAYPPRPWPRAFMPSAARPLASDRTSVVVQLAHPIGHGRRRFVAAWPDLQQPAQRGSSSPPLVRLVLRSPTLGFACHELCLGKSVLERDAALVCQRRAPFDAPGRAGSYGPLRGAAGIDVAPRSRGHSAVYECMQ